MGTITSERIIEQARYTLNDISDEVRWTDGELLRYLSDGQRLAVKLDNMANPVTEPLALTVNSSKQSIPTDAYALITVVRIMGGTGTTIQKMNYVVATRNIPGWHEAEGDPTHFLYEPKADRRTFYVYPHPTSAVSIEIVISKIPAELDDITDTIELDDVYEPALVSYVLHRGFAKDIAAQGQEHMKVEFYFKQFMAGLGMAGG